MATNEALVHSILDSLITSAYLDGELGEVEVILLSKDMKNYIKHGAYVDPKGMNLRISIKTTWLPDSQTPTEDEEDE